MIPVVLTVTPRCAALRLAVAGALYNLPEPRGWWLSGGDVPQVGRTDRAVLVLDALTPGRDWRLEVEGFAPVAFATPPCPGTVAPDLLPASGLADLDAARANARALQSAIAALPPGGTVVLPPGDWLATPVALRSDMILHLSAGAVLRAPSDRTDWPILPARAPDGRMLGSWEGLPAACFKAPLHAVAAERLVIEGPGTLDGSGGQGDWWSWPKDTRSGARRPRGLHLVDCRDVTLLGFTLRNAPSWSLHPQGCQRLSAFGMAIEAPADSPNTDGFNPEMCRDVRIEGVRFSVGDDCIAVKAGKRGDAGEADHLSETRGVTIRHCLMERGHGGLVIGSEMSGGVHEVLVEDCAMIGTDRGLRLKTRRGRGGAVTDITFRRVRMQGVETALAANAHYFCDHDGHADWVQSRAPAPVTERTPLIDGITIEDVEVQGLAHAAGCFLGLPEAPIRNIRIRNLRILSLDPEACATSPIMADRVRAMRHAGISAEAAQIDCDDPALIDPTPITLSPDEPER